MSANAADVRSIDTYRSSLGAYSEDVLRIVTKQALQVPFVFNRAQQIVHDRLTTQLRETGRVRAIVLKARQEGISTYTAARFFRRVTLYPNQSALVVADQRKRGKKLFKIYELFDRKQPGWIAPAKLHHQRGWNLHYDTALGEGLNSELTVETAKDTDTGRASTIQAVHASELAFWDNPEETWTSLSQAVPDDDSEIIVESTANGVGNMFHQMWLDAENGDSDYLPIFLPWWIHEEYRTKLSTEQKHELAEMLTPDEEKMVSYGYELDGVAHKLSLEQVAWRRQTIRNKLNGDDGLFKQEYPATAREAFLVSGNCFFDEDSLLRYEEAAVPPKRYKLSWQNNGVIRMPAPRGQLRIWADPDKDGEYVIFADTATGKRTDKRESIYASDREQGGRDFSCAWVYDVHARSFVACYHGRIPPEDFADKVFALGYFYGHPSIRTGNKKPALVGVERNHKSGETVLRRLRDAGYPNLFFDRLVNQRREKRTMALGWYSTEGKRIMSLDELAGELRESTVGLLDVDTIRECFTFIRGDDGRPEAQEGCHDDRVIAAAGCLQMARHHFMPGISSGRTLVRRGGPVGHLVEEEGSHGSERPRSPAGV